MERNSWKNWWKILIVLLLVVVVAVVVANKGRETTPEPAQQAQAPADVVPQVDVEEQEPAEDAATAADTAEEETAEPAVKEPTPEVKKAPPAVKQTQKQPEPPKEPDKKAERPKPAEPKVAKKLPKLLDFGADYCKPCRTMKPILEQIKKDYAGKLDLQIIDVTKNRGAGEKYGFQYIPTQIFYDTNGKEFYRNTGLISRHDILEKFKEHGMDLGEPTSEKS